jgi:hypothetical protein
MSKSERGAAVPDDPISRGEATENEGPVPKATKG